MAIAAENAKRETPVSVDTGIQTNGVVRPKSETKPGAAAGTSMVRAGKWGASCMH